MLDQVANDTRRQPLDAADLTRRIADILQDRKAQDVVVIDLRSRASYTDFLVICSGTSDRHVQGIAELVHVTLAHEGLRSIGSEGVRQGQWALLDYGNVVVHVFHQFTRQVYDLEDMWREAPRLPVPQPEMPRLQAGAWAPGP